MSSNFKLSRRTLLKTTVAVTPFSFTGCTSVAHDDEPLVRTGDPVARSLAYYSDTRDVAKDDPLATTHDVKQRCANCVHSREGAGPGRLECPMFPGRRVNENGWCSIWARG